MPTPEPTSRWDDRRGRDATASRTRSRSRSSRTAAAFVATIEPPPEVGPLLERLAAALRPRDLLELAARQHARSVRRRRGLGALPGGGRRLPAGRDDQAGSADLPRGRGSPRVARGRDPARRRRLGRRRRGCAVAPAGGWPTWRRVSPTRRSRPASRATTSSRTCVSTGSRTWRWLWRSHPADERQPAHGGGPSRRGRRLDSGGWTRATGR